MKGKLFLSIVFMNLIFVVANAQNGGLESLTLERCIAVGLENNLELQRSELNREVNEANLLEAQGQRLPSFSASASSRYNWGRSINPVTNLFETRRIGNINISANTNMTIFAGGQVNNGIKQARVDAEAGLHDVEATKNNITLNIINLFVNVVFAKEQLKVAGSQLKVTEEQLERTKRLVQAGSLPLSDQLDIEAQNATSELELINAKNNLRLARLNLSQAIQVPFEESFDVTVPDLDADDYYIGEETIGEIVEIAEATMPEIKSAQLGVESAEYGVKMAKGAFYPSLGLGGNVFSNYVDQTVDFGGNEPFGAQIENNLSQALGLNLNIPVFSNYRNRASLQRARVQKKLSEVRKQETKNQLRQDIETAYTNAMASWQSYKSSQKRVQSLQEAFRMAQQRFDLGAINAVDFQVAQNNLFGAQADLLNAKYEYIFRVKVLDFYLGNPLTL